MARTIDQILDEVIETEGGYVNDPDDAGGETKYGITIAVARKAGWFGPMRDLPRDLAKDIYRRRYVTEPKFHEVLGMSAALAAELIDTGVNMGPHRAGEFLQRWLNAFNDTGSRYQNVFVDGRVGVITLNALRAFLAWRRAEGERVLLRALNGIQCSRYLEIAEAKPSQRKYLFGWVLNRVQI
jgi:lysozyme family protein